MQLSGFLLANYISLTLTLLQVIGGWNGAITTARAQEPVPYLLFTTQHSIHRLYLNGSEDAELISSPAQFQIQKIDYHYRLGQMFWIDSNLFRAEIMTSRLDGSDQMVLVSTGLNSPADLVVDWLNDKLYWVDTELRQIEEYDLITGIRRLVASTGAEGESTPITLALYPYPNYGWLYWSDSTSRSIQMVSVQGDSRSTFHTNIDCANALTIDYASHTIYWIDQCTFEIESLRLDGDSMTHSFPLNSNIFFSSGVTIYENTLYWAGGSGIFSANRSEAENPEIKHIFITSNTRATGIQVVHPSQQPSAEVYEDIVNNVNNSFTFECDGDCIHGNCIAPGLCACNFGWRGDLCDTDIKECSEGNGGCDQECIELDGGFQCNCSEGYVLTYDLRTCSVGCDDTVVTVVGGPSPTATFDPCLHYIRETLTTTSFTPTPLHISVSTSLLVSTSSSSSAVVVSSSMSSNTVVSSRVVQTSTVPTVVASAPSSSQYLPESTTTRQIDSSSLIISPHSTQHVSTIPPSEVVSNPQGSSAKLSSSAVTDKVFPTPDIAIVDESIKETEDESIIFGLGVYAVIGIGGGIALLIICSITLLIIIILCVRYKKRKNRSWSPQKSIKINGNGEVHGIDSTSMKPVNENGNNIATTLSKDEEAELELDREKACQNVYVDQV